MIRDSGNRVEFFFYETVVGVLYMFVATEVEELEIFSQYSNIIHMRNTQKMEIGRNVNGKH